MKQTIRSYFPGFLLCALLLACVDTNTQELITAQGSNPSPTGLSPGEPSETQDMPCSPYPTYYTDLPSAVQNIEIKSVPKTPDNPHQLEITAAIVDAPAPATETTLSWSRFQLLDLLIAPAYACSIPDPHQYNYAFENPPTQITLISNLDYKDIKAGKPLNASLKYMENPSLHLDQYPQIFQENFSQSQYRVEAFRRVFVFENPPENIGAHRFSLMLTLHNGDVLKASEKSDP